MLVILKRLNAQSLLCSTTCSATRIVLALVLASTTSLITNTASALEFECSKAQAERFIRVELPGKDHLCEVTVTNEQSQRQVQWYANHDSQFCTKKAGELKQKYIDQWDFNCQNWPDRDGITELSPRHRTILDAELKFLIEEGAKADPAFTVHSVKAAASDNSVISNDHRPSTLALQFFLNNNDQSQPADRTYIITDDGVSWNTYTKIDSLAKHILPEKGYRVSAALISTVNDAGAVEITTFMNKEGQSTTPSTKVQGANCYGNQTMTPQGNGNLIARSPHRYVCSAPDEEDAAGEG